MSNHRSLKVLAIGNSFSQDATAYLSQIAASAGVDMTVGNLYIGGCPLKLHAENIAANAPAYTYYRLTGDCVESADNAAIQDALLSEQWDVVTLQQASHDSGRWETYQPYLSQVSSYVAQLAPQARQMIHQTWAYEIDSDHEGFAQYHHDQLVMFDAIRSAYHNAAEVLNISVIPSGEAVQMARQTAPFDYAHGGKSLCRDGFHMRIPHGRYLLGCVWFEALTGISTDNADFLPRTESEVITEEEAAVLRQCAHRAVAMTR